MKLSIYALAFTATIGFGAANFGAFAQQSATLSAATGQVDPAEGEKLQAALKQKALTRPLRNPPPVGVKARDAILEKIDWIGMRTQLAISQRKDAAATNTVSARIPRPPGFRATSPQSFKRVRALEINRTRLPVLAPEGPRVAGSLRVYSLGDSFSTIAEIEDGISMRLSGTRKKIIIGDDKTARRRIAAIRKARKMLQSLDTDYVVTRSNSSTDLSFSKFGAGFVLSIMCDEPSDTRCAEDDYIVNLGSNLLLLNPEAGDE